MADHDEEEEFLEIGILLFSRQRSRKARKVPTSRKKNIWVRKVHLVKELSLVFIFEVERLFIVQTGRFAYSLYQFFFKFSFHLLRFRAGPDSAFVFFR